jgi:hypothetical protein
VAQKGAAADRDAAVPRDEQGGLGLLISAELQAVAAFRRIEAGQQRLRRAQQRRDVGLVGR